ncbi:MAG: helix-turn-helix domain-containing protein [Thermomicrobiales bacterium]|nr:helix-turn-helix domain-containing protein [Thermomicrobiales bacterium]MCO5222349.1 helix-turn-helix domain-containing protein [Thermomicrobiales bacterium]
MSVFGDTLRQARAQKGITLRQAEQEIRINRHYLAALEDETFENLPALPYQRGIVRTYAAYLGLDQTRLVELFDEARGTRPDDPPRIEMIEPVEMPSHWAPNFAVIAFTLIAGAIIFAWLYSAYFKAPTVSDSTMLDLQPTVTRVSEDQIFVPSPTPDLPTPTATAVPTEIPVDPPTETVPPPATEDAAAGAISNSPQIQAISVETPADSSTGESGIARSVPSELPNGAVAIRITAQADIYVQIAADGVQYFQGNLVQGESTDWIVGHTFSVYTTSGANTLFTNNQGTQFVMGTEQGEVVYTL